MPRLPDHDWTDPSFASQWSALAGELNPVRQEQIDLLIALLRARNPETVLDIGVGSGLVAEPVLEALPATRLIGLDGSDAMLALARDRLARFGNRARLVTVDLAQIALSDPVDQPVDAAISVQTLHNLEPAAHQRLLSSAAGAMRPGGMLIIADRYAVPVELFDAFQVVWDRLGVDEGASPDEHASLLRRHRDQPVSLLTELHWLEQSGFAATCLKCAGNRALVVARRR